MRKLLIILLLAFATTISAIAIQIPESEISENRDGRQLIIRTFTLTTDENPESLIKYDFERDGHMYSFFSIVQEPTEFERRKVHSETVTLESGTGDLAEILRMFDTTISFDDGEYSGTLFLDHTSIRTEAAGYRTRTFTTSTTRTIEGLERNDPSLVPRTTVHNGVTLNLQSIEWIAQGGTIGSSLEPTQFTAIASYSAQTSRRVPDGHITTAIYSGEIASSGISSIIYTVTYVGEPIVIVTEPEPEIETEHEPEAESLYGNEETQGTNAFPLIGYLVIVGLILAVLAFAVATWLHYSKNTKVYSLINDGNEFELIGKLRITAKKLLIDLQSMRSYPPEAAVIEIKASAARKLYGRLIKIQLRDGAATHMIEQAGNGNYIFTVATSTVEGDIPK